MRLPSSSQPKNTGSRQHLRFQVVENRRKLAHRQEKSRGRPSNSRPSITCKRQNNSFACLKKGLAKIRYTLRGANRGCSRQHNA
ncbi:hypothetical protein GRAN_0921 [Granulicella sibirica]|uniref:Uncharacterized protein n=1 Tax=Granulicella sibirica TaxID=2479048 RepID=A0A4Q0T7N2_9BACT|nr:hypothetical protein GRAN_0921 [Granulicella sibirica]